MLNKNIQQDANRFKYLTYIATIYTFFFILPSILLKKMVTIPVLGTIPISILFTGTYFVILDIVTEVYGFYEARKMMVGGLIAYTLFVFTMESVIRIHSPEHYHVTWSTVQDHQAYTYLFSNLYLVWFSVVICTLVANSLNMILLSKWKVLVKGRIFWLRSVTTSLFSALLFSLLSNLFAFGIFLKFSQIPYFLELVLISVSAKCITLVLFAYPAAILCAILKKKEGVDFYYQLNYNPFQKNEKLN